MGLLLRLCTCVLLIAAAAVYKISPPGKLGKVSDTIDRYLYGNVDYRSALSVMGKAFSGEQSAFDAIPAAWSYAFGIQDKESGGSMIEVSAIEETEPEPEREKLSTEPEIEVKTLDKAITETPQITEDEESSQVSTAVAAFLEKQEAFSDMELPDNATYEMPQIDLNFGLPANGVVSSSFGYRMHPVENRVIFHYGTDIAAPEGDDISAFADGTVYAVGESTGYGKYIIVRHEGGVMTQYSHCSSITAKQGSAVAKGDVIAKVGSSGNATSACLHFEITVDGIYVNPEFYLSWS